MVFVFAKTPRPTPCCAAVLLRISLGRAWFCEPVRIVGIYRIGNLYDFNGLRMIRFP